jgi:hypothetical protein
MYEVSCKTVIDTIGYRLESIRVLQAACSDAFGLGLPDMYIQISAPNNGGLLFDSSPDVPNITLPHTFSVGTPARKRKLPAPGDGRGQWC